MYVGARFRNCITIRLISLLFILKILLFESKRTSLCIKDQSIRSQITDLMFWSLQPGEKHFLWIKTGSNDLTEPPRLRAVEGINLSGRSEGLIMTSLLSAFWVTITDSLKPWRLIAEGHGKQHKLRGKNIGLPFAFIFLHAGILQVYIKLFAWKSS